MEDIADETFCPPKTIYHSPENRRNGAIELLRFIFAFSLVSRHMGRLLPDEREVFLYGGHIAFEFFFILTGYFLYEYSRKMDTGKIPAQENAFLEAFRRCSRYYGYLLVPWVISFSVKTLFNWQGLPALMQALQKSIPQLLFLSAMGIDGQTLQVYNEQLCYASAMFFAILILYPLIRRWKVHFAAAAAPVFSAIHYGRCMIVYHCIGPTMEWMDYWYAMVPRAIAGMCLGCFCNVLVHIVPPHRLNKKGDAIVSLLQLGVLLLILSNMEYRAGSTDMIQIVCFSFLIFLTFSETTTLNRICDCKLSAFLGKASVVLFATQSLPTAQLGAYLPYPEQWVWKYLTYLIYIVLFSLLNYIVVENVRRRHIVQKVKQSVLETDK